MIISLLYFVYCLMRLLWVKGILPMSWNVLFNDLSLIVVCIAYFSWFSYKCYSYYILCKFNSLEDLITASTILNQRSNNLKYVPFKIGSVVVPLTKKQLSILADLLTSEYEETGNNIPSLSLDNGDTIAFRYSQHTNKVSTILLERDNRTIESYSDINSIVADLESYKNILALQAPEVEQCYDEICEECNNLYEKEEK